MTEKYLRIDPSGKISWIPLDRVARSYGDLVSLSQIYSAIGCDCIETVRTIIRNVVLVVDECGRIKDPPQCHNELASRLYLGWLRGMDDIVGPAIVFSLRPCGPYNELELFPLDQAELNALSLLLGVELPEE